MAGAGYNIPISLSVAASSGNETDLGLNTYVDFGDGGLFAPEYAPVSATPANTASSAAAEDGNAGSSAATGGLPLTTAGIDTNWLLWVALGGLAWYVLRKKI